VLRRPCRTANRCRAMMNLRDAALYHMGCGVKQKVDGLRGCRLCGIASVLIEDACVFAKPGIPQSCSGTDLMES
jgi:hypothetical protein